MNFLIVMQLTVIKLYNIKFTPPLIPTREFLKEVFKPHGEKPG
jgi:hypothetical protein